MTISTAAADSHRARRRALAPIRVMHLLAPAPVGGLESVVAALSAAQKQADVDVHVLAVLDEGARDHALLDALEGEGVVVHRVMVPPRAYRYERACVASILRTVQPDIAHTHGYRSDVLHGSVARRLGIATVSTTHGFIDGGFRNRIYEYLQRRALRRCDAVVAVSRAMATRLVDTGMRSDRVVCIPNGWTAGVTFVARGEARATLGISAEPFTLGFIGRLGWEKGPDVLLRALSEVKLPVKAVFIGDGRMREQLQADTPSDADVTWAGAIDGAGRLMRAFDLVVLPSRTEGTPVVLLEALAAGIPVVATRVGGIPDVVSADEALLVEPDNPTALAAAITAVMSNPAAAATRALAGFERLQRERNADAWLSAYDEVYRSCRR